MGYGYPVVLRQKAVEAYQAGHGSIDEIAVVFGIGSATLKRWMWRKRDDNALEPRPYGGGNKVTVHQTPSLRDRRNFLILRASGRQATPSTWSREYAADGKAVGANCSGV